MAIQIQKEINVLYTNDQKRINRQLLDVYFFTPKKPVITASSVIAG